MVKPIVITCSAGANAISAKDILEADGAGAVQKVDDAANATAAIGVAAADKDSQNNVGVMIQGLAKLPAAAASYNFGDKLGANSSGVAAYSSGVVLGLVAEPETKIINTGYSTTDQLLVYVNIDESSLA